MTESLFRRPYFWARLRTNPLAEIIEEYVAHFHGLRYSWSTIRAHVQGLQHFGCWLHSKGLDATAVNRKLVRSFICDHFPKCRCPAPATKILGVVRPALNHLLRLLQKKGIVKEVAFTLPIDEVLNQYRTHLQDVCGQAESTCTSRLRYAREFLEGKFGRRKLRWKALSPNDASIFLKQYSQRVSRSSLQPAASSLRNFFRFLQVNDLCGPQIVASVPRIKNWKHAGLPKGLSKRQIRKILATFDRRNAVGRRNSAMVLCLVLLGMRVSEVANLELDHIDWRRGIIRIPINKSRRYRELPLPNRVGAAISSYLRNGRLSGQSRSVFVRHKGARGSAVTNSLIKGVVRLAYAKIPECSHLYGTHVLRHTAATGMLHRGANLKEIADILGHTSIETTALYAKVNLTSLATVALPWPEAQ